MTAEKNPFETLCDEVDALTKEAERPRRNKAEVLHYLTRLCAAAHKSSALLEALYNDRPQSKGDAEGRREALKILPEYVLGLSLLTANTLDELAAM